MKADDRLILAFALVKLHYYSNTDQGVNSDRLAKEGPERAEEPLRETVPEAATTQTQQHDRVSSHSLEIVYAFT